MRINFYDRIYYSIYSLLSRIGRYDLGFQAMFLYGVVLSFNVITILTFFWEKEDFENIANYWGAALFLIPIWTINYFYFVYRKRYKKIEQSLNKIEGKCNKGAAIAGAVYIVASFVLFIIAARQL